MELIKAHTQLLKDIMWEKVQTFDDYIIAESFIRQDRDWNQLTPLVDLPSLRKESVDTFLNQKNQDGWYFSYYIQEQLLPSYSAMLAAENYKPLLVDMYMFKTITGEAQITLADKEVFVELGKDDLDQYIQLAVQAFEGWENEEPYSRKFFEYGRERGDKQLRTFLIKRGETIICFGSLVYSRSQNVAYLHNSGTNILFRRQGYFALLKKLMLNYLLQEKVTNVYTVVEEGGASALALADLGFEIRERYHTFSNRI